MADIEEVKEFDLVAMSLSFQSCLKDGDVVLNDYIKGYKELNKLLASLGKIFFFVTKDVTDKISILSKHLISESGSHYCLVSAMLDYEVTNDIIKTKHHLANGSRTLLRLHRALLFLLGLMEKLCAAENEDGYSSTLAEITYNSYHASLADHHPWAIRKTVGFAVRALPTKETFIQRIADNQPSGPMSIQQCRDEFRSKTIPAMRQVYDLVQSFYEKRDLLSLP